MPGYIPILAVVVMILTQDSDGCTPELCEAHCEFGYHNVDVFTSWGQQCSCMCCPPPVCRLCAMRRKIIARDNKGCLSCRCGWMLK